jgi:hypothetical protein
MKKKIDGLEVTLYSTSSVSIENRSAQNGWGEDGEKVILDGEIKEIEIKRKGITQVGFRIKENGEVVLTDFGNLYFCIDVGQTLVLKPQNGWREEIPKTGRQRRKRDPEDL